MDKIIIDIKRVLPARTSEINFGKVKGHPFNGFKINIVTFPLFKAVSFVTIK